MKKIISFVLLIFFVFQVANFDVNAYSEQVDGLSNVGILVVTDSKNDFSGLIKIYGDYADFYTEESLQLVDFDSYQTIVADYKVASEKSALQNLLIQQYNNNKQVYMFGQLTISDFKDILELDRFRIPTQIIGDDNPRKMSFELGTDQEYNQIENIISHSLNANIKCLIASVDNYHNNKELISLILGYAIDNLNKIAPRAILIDAQYDFRVYFNGLYVNTDYLLYKENSESIVDLDFYAIVANITMVGGGGNTLEVVQQATRSDAQVIDYGPGSVSRASTLSVAMNMVTGQPTVRFSFSVGGGPTIKTNFYPDAEKVEWKVTKYWFFGSNIDGELFKFGSSWSNQPTGTEMQIKFRGIWKIGGHTATTTWKTVNVSTTY